MKTNIINHNDLLEIGKIIKPHGIKGEMVVTDYSDDFEEFKKLKTVFTKIKGSEWEKLSIKGIRGSKNKIILSLENINTRDESEKLRNKALYIQREEITLEEDEYFFADLIGCNCYFEGQHLGEVLSMPNYGTCDMFEIDFYEADNKKRIINIPYFKEIIDKIDISNKSIYFKEDYKDYL